MTLWKKVMEQKTSVILMVAQEHLTAAALFHSLLNYTNHLAHQVSISLLKTEMCIVVMLDDCLIQQLFPL